MVVVEDDHELREQVVSQLNAAAEFDCLGNFENCETGIAGVLKHKPDVVLMDIQMPDGSGVDCVGEILKVEPGIRIIMYTAFENSKEVFSALRAGASGYILKRRSFDEIRDAIIDVCNGGAPMTPRIARKVIGYFAELHRLETQDTGLEPLTEREDEVLNLVAKGYQNKEIAQQLNISAETVRVHLRNVYTKWQVSNRAEATATYLNQRG